MLCILLYTASHANNFIVGLTNTEPSPPTVPSYELCGQYPGAVTRGATHTVTCATGLEQFRYVVVLPHPDAPNGQFCEIEVMVPGM